MGKKKKERIDASTTSSPSSPFNNAFGGLAALRASIGDAPSPAEDPAPAVAPKAAPVTGTGRKIVVAREKKGRGGKTVTRVSQLELDAEATEALVHTLKRTLGCGGTVEDGDVILSGDQTDRVPALLVAELGRRVVVGN